MNRDVYHSQALTQRCFGAHGIGGIVVFACSGQGGGGDKKLALPYIRPANGIATTPAVAPPAMQPFPTPHKWNTAFPVENNPNKTFDYDFVVLP